MVEISISPFKTTLHAYQLSPEDQELLRKHPLYNDARSYAKQLIKDGLGLPALRPAAPEINDCTEVPDSTQPVTF